MSTNTRVRRIGRAGAVLTVTGLSGLALLLGGGVATAHVTARVIGEDAKQGGFTKITFRVPNEDTTAGTVKVEIKVPPANPIASLRTKAVPGWTAQITRSKLDTPVKTEEAEITEAVSAITWTANPGVRINPGEFAEFEVSGGPLPSNTDKLVMPAVQTYDNGKVVSWDAPPAPAGAEEPEHPAPVITLAPAGAEAAAGGAQTGNQQVTNTAGTASTAAGGTDTTARWLGGIGLAVGALGLGVGAGATLRARRTVAAAKVGEETS